MLRRAFQARGHWALSIDLAPADDGATLGANGGHWQGDPFDVLAMIGEESGREPDLFIVHPDCRYLASSGLHWNMRRPERAALTEAALIFVKRCWNVPAARTCLENPQGCINTRLPFMPRPQYVQPYDFGDDASKRTGLWLRNLPSLAPTRRVSGRIVNGRERWSNQTDSGQNRLGPSPRRAAMRAETYPGIAAAMAEQWGGLPI
jgi:hypothetical protein